MQIRNRRPASEDSGFALLGVLILLIIISAVSAAIVFSTISEKSNSGTEQQKNTAFYAAEAGMEKLTADLGTLYATNKAPTISQIHSVEGGTYQPSVSNGVNFNEYKIAVAPSAGDATIPASTTQSISSGSNSGLIAQIIHMQLQATAQTGTQGEVRMTRDIEVALIPVFQFGVFSQSDLAFFPGPTFDFNGRVFTNGNLFLAAQNGPLTLHAKVQAVGEVIRTNLPNGVDATPRAQAVNIPTSPGGCDGAKPACRDLKQTEGSLKGTLGSAANPGWVNLATVTYGGMLQNGTTGVKPLNLPFVGPGVSPYEIIRRPPSAESANSPIGTSRLYNQAQIRILIEDIKANLPGGGRATDINLANYSGAVSGVAGAQFMAQGIQLQAASCAIITKTHPANTCSGWDTNWFNPTGVNNLNAPWPLITGWLRVEFRKADGTYQDVTQEWLTLGFARQGQDSVAIPQAVPNLEAGIANTVHPKAILLFQFPQDGFLPAPPTATTQYDWYPINMYDQREGEVRDNVAAGSSCAVGGLMNIVELDMDNLRKWLNGANGTNGTNVESSSQNGYIVYFSDRRGMQLDAANGATELNGEYGFEDVINIADPAGAPNGVLDTGEDVNGNGRLDKYGIAHMGDGFGLAAANADPYSTRFGTCSATARVNRVTGPRHAIRAVNGSLGHLPLKPNGTGGTTIASENPVYIQGNYNANNAGFGGSSNGVNEAAAAAISDAVTLLSTAYTDLRGFQNPTNLGNRPGATTFYRLAIASGKNLNFPAPTAWNGGDNYGTDGGIHNFLRYLENWGGTTSNYSGSLVSFYYARQAVGVFKCCNVVYGAPNRNYAFDTNFLDPAKLPPGTPRFQDIDNLGYHQDFRPQ